jgi:hypothetical protein
VSTGRFPYSKGISRMIKKRNKLKSYLREVEELRAIYMRKDERESLPSHLQFNDLIISVKLIGLPISITMIELITREDMI